MYISYIKILDEMKTSFDTIFEISAYENYELLYENNFLNVIHEV